MWREVSYKALTLLTHNLIFQTLETRIRAVSSQDDCTLVCSDSEEQSEIGLSVLTSDSEEESRSGLSVLTSDSEGLSLIHI